MAPRGIAAAVFAGSLILAVTMLTGVGYFASLGNVQIDAGSQNDDVREAAETLGVNNSDSGSGIGFGEDRSNSILEGPLAVVTPVVDIFMTFVGVIGNLSGFLELLFGLPNIVAETIELFFRIGMVVTLIYLVRSGSPV